jgi:hypothetical protein
VAECGGLLIHSDPFTLIDLHLFCQLYKLLSCTGTPHLQSNAYQVLSRNLTDSAAIFRTSSRAGQLPDLTE